MNVGLCECPQGMLKGPCKHKQAVANEFQLSSLDTLFNATPRLRAFYHFLATGESRDANWYRGLADADEISNATTVTSGLFYFMKEDEGPEESGENTEDTD